MLCDSNQPSFPFFPPERRVGETLERKPWVVGNRSKKKPICIEVEVGEGQGKRPLPFWRGLIIRGCRRGKRIQKCTQNTGVAPWLRAAVLWLLPQVQSYHSRMRVPGIVQNGAFLEEAPCCLQRAERGGEWTSQDDPRKL